MNKISKFLPYLIVHILIGIIVCILSSFYLPVKENLLTPFLFGWRIRRAILFFVMYFPFIFISALILAYSIIFGKHGPLSMPKHAPIMMKFIKSFFIMIISVSIIYILLCEVARPIMIEKQEKALQESITYNEYKKLAKEAYSRKEYPQALSHINRAIIVWPTSEEALKLQEEIKVSYSELVKDDDDYMLKNKLSDELAFKSEYTAEQALKTAEKAMLLLDFYTAHYYAKMAFKSFNDDNPLKQNAEKIADRAWKEIEKGKARYLEEDEINHFKKKRLAYEAMQAGNFIEAYYSFMEINKELKASDADKKDPEIERFLRLSKENLLKNVFFIDELDHIPNFKVDKNIKFAIDMDKHLYIKIYGLTRVNGKNGHEIYLMDAELSKITLGKKMWSIKLPFAKIKKGADSKLLLQIKAVNRKERNNALTPEVIVGNFPVNTKYNIPLNFGFEDFKLIEEASLGPHKMKLTSLYYFISLAEKYGFKEESFIRELLFRLAEPFILLIVSIFSVILAWKFRLVPGKRFRKIWIFTIPLCFTLAYVLIETARYLYKLQIAIFVSLTPVYAPYIIFALLISLFIFMTVRLSAMHCE